MCDWRPLLERALDLLGLSAKWQWEIRPADGAESYFMETNCWLACSRVLEAPQEDRPGRALFIFRTDISPSLDIAVHESLHLLFDPWPDSSTRGFETNILEEMQVSQLARVLMRAVNGARAPRGSLEERVGALRAFLDLDVNDWRIHIEPAPRVAARSLYWHSRMGWGLFAARQILLQAPESADNKALTAALLLCILRPYSDPDEPVCSREEQIVSAIMSALERAHFFQEEDDGG